jgi:hypothetical protein
MCTSRDQKQLDETKLKSEQPRKKRGGGFELAFTECCCLCFVCLYKLFMDCHVT